MYDDYAHHPTEVAAALPRPGASSEAAGSSPCISRTCTAARRDMAEQFAETYEQLADHTIVLDVFGAREDPIPGVTGATVSERFTR